MSNQLYRRIFYTICIYLNHLAFVSVVLSQCCCFNLVDICFHRQQGITSNTLWFALIDCRYIYGTSIETISYLVSFSSLGYLLGSLFGFFYKWLNRQLTLAFLTALLAITIALVPYYGHVWLLFVCIVVNGLGGGSWDSSNNVWLVEMWTENNAPVMQSSQFFYGMGTIVGPMIVGPYVHGENNHTTGYVWSGEQRQKLLTFPFALVGLLQLIIPIVLFISYFVIRYHNKPSDSHVHKLETADAREILHGDKSVPQPTKKVSNRRMKILAMAIFLGAYDAAEIGYFFFAPTAFQYMEIKMEASETAKMSSILSGAYTFGRLFSAVVSLKLAPDYIIMYHFVIIAFAQVFLFLVRHNQTLIFVGTALLGFGFSAMWPAILGFTQRHLRLSNKAGSVLFFSAGVMSLFTPLIVGHFINTYPLVLFLFELIYLAVAVLCYAVIKFILLPYH